MDILTIDDEYLLAVVLQTKEPSLNLYVYTIPSRNRYTGEGQIELLAIFDLPQLTQPVSLDLDCFFFHVLGSKCNGGIGSAPSDFHPSLIFFDLTITDQDNDVQLLAPISVLTRMADAARQEQPTRIQWTEWGPEHTRFSTPPDVHDFVAIIGYRALCWDEIWDFNPHGRPNSQIAEDNTQWVTSASVTPPNAIFSQEIITRLPYKRTFIPGMPQIIEIPTSRYFFEDIDGPKVWM